MDITLAKHSSKLPDDGSLTETCRSILKLKKNDVNFNLVVHSVG